MRNNPCATIPPDISARHTIPTVMGQGSSGAKIKCSNHMDSQNSLKHIVKCKGKETSKVNTLKVGCKQGGRATLPDSWLFWTPDSFQRVVWFRRSPRDGTYQGQYIYWIWEKQVDVPDPSCDLPVSYWTAVDFTWISWAKHM